MEEIRTIVVHQIGEDAPEFLSDDPRKGIIWRRNDTFIRVLALPHNENYILKDIWFDNDPPEWVIEAVNCINCNFPNSRDYFNAVWDWDENED